MARKWRTVWGVLGLSVMLSGCLEFEATTTVLEDGTVIDHMVVQPKNSLLALLSLSARGVEAGDRASDLERSGALGEAQWPALLQDLRILGNACSIADLIYEEAFAGQGIPYSAVSVPTDFEIPGIVGSGCSIQIGPYDPRTLPAEFAEEMLGIRVAPERGLHQPYRMSAVSIEEALDDMPSSAPMDVAALQAMCSGELEPALCQQELRVLLALVGSMDAEDDEAGEFGEILADPVMLGGTAEFLRMVLKSMPVTLRIPDNSAVSMAHGTWAFEFGQGWIWRGSAMEWIAASTNPGMSLQVRPNRLPMPSSR